MYMLEENQNKVKGVVSAYRVVLAINDMTLYLGFNGININNISQVSTHQNKVKGVVSAYRVVLAINDMTLYLGFNGININNISQVSTRNILSLASLLTGRSHRLCGHQFIGCNIEIWRKYEV